MTTSSPPASVVLRRTVPVQSQPLWAMLGLGLAAVGLAASAFLSDRLLLMTAVVVALVFAGVTVLYRPFVGVLVIMTTMLVSYPAALRGFGPITINNLLGAALIATLAFQVYRSHDYWFFREPEIRLLVAIAALLILTQILSRFFLPDVRHMLPKIEKAPGAGFYGTVDNTNRWMFELLSRIAFAIFFANWVCTARQMRAVLVVFAFCILAVIPSLGMDAFRGSADTTRISSKLVGWAANPNRFAFMVNLGVALFVYLANILRSPLLKLLSLLGAAACVPLVLLSASRSGMLGLGVVGFMLLAQPQISRRAKAVAALGGLALGVLAFFFLLGPDQQERLLNLNPFAVDARAEGSRSTEQRVATLGEALHIIRKYPIFGVGLGNFRWVNMYLHGSWKPPHNSYVWSWSEGGIFVAGSYLLLFGFLFARIQRLRPQYADHPVVPHLPDFLNLYLVLFFFFSIFADVWLEVHLYFIVAIAIVLSRWARDEELRARALPGTIAGSPGARRAATRALYRQKAAP